jgi:hypothetical protein
MKRLCFGGHLKNVRYKRKAKSERGKALAAAESSRQTTQRVERSVQMNADDSRGYFALADTSAKSPAPKELGPGCCQAAGPLSCLSSASIRVHPWLNLRLAALRLWLISDLRPPTVPAPFATRHKFDLAPGDPAARLSLCSSLFGRRGDLSSAPPAVRSARFPSLRPEAAGSALGFSDHNLFTLNR